MNPEKAGPVPAFLCPHGSAAAAATIEPMDLFLITVASFFAGFIDSIVGGGGLILLPALFAVYPTTHPATLFGVNKSASIWGTAAATWQYANRVKMPWDALLPAAATAFAFSMFGAWCVTQVSPEWLRRVLPVMLVVLLFYTLAKKSLGREHLPRFAGRRQQWAASLLGGVIGFYDGFFGPGTGSFLVFFFVRWLGFDFLHASASAKLINTASNLAALILFSWKGHVWWHLALAMAVANVLGSLLGTRMALKHGSGFVRVMFLIVVGALILKTGWDAWVRSTF